MEAFGINENSNVMFRMNMYSRKLVRSENFFGYDISNNANQGVKAANMDMYCVQLTKLSRSYLKRSVTKRNIAVDVKSI